jgi:dTDP-4-dehydrorhamnose reductase
MKLFVLGGFGQLGSDLALAASERHELVRPAHSELDVTDGTAVARAIVEAAPEAVVNAAAFHKTEACEQQPERAFAVNSLGAIHVARGARSAGARCVFISTDYVFSGDRSRGYTEDDAVAPVNIYGISKAAGERAVLNLCPNSLVVRTSGLFGHAGSSGKGGNFVELMLSKGGRREAITVVDDQVLSPTSTRDLAQRILLLLERAAPPGTYHVTNSGACSWYGLARKTFELAGIEADLSPRASDHSVVRRPAYSVLVAGASTIPGLAPMRPWEDALAWYLRERTPAAPVPARA